MKPGNAEIYVVVEIREDFARAADPDAPDLARITDTLKKHGVKWENAEFPDEGDNPDLLGAEFFVATAKGRKAAVALKSDLEKIGAVEKVSIDGGPGSCLP